MKTLSAATGGCRSATEHVAPGCDGLGGILLTQFMNVDLILMDQPLDRLPVPPDSNGRAGDVTSVGF